jgi:hypothetical protein
MTIQASRTVRGVEVTMTARTWDGITNSLGVIDLCDSTTNWMKVAIGDVMQSMPATPV